MVFDQTELPSYYHLSPTQIEGLSFHVTVRCARGNGSRDALPKNEVVSQDIAWQEKISRLSNGDDAGPGIRIFTYTSAEATPYEMKSAKNETKGSDALLGGSKFQGFSLRKDIDSNPKAKRSHQTELNDRLFREDACQTMVIMASAGMNSSSTDFQEEELCVVKLSATGLVSACPGLSEVEAEDCDGNRIFMSDKGMSDVIDKGPRLTTYSFMLAGSLYEYTIQCNAGTDMIDGETELMVAEDSNIDREINDERRELIRKEFESLDCMYEKGDKNFENQAHVEILSVDEFVGSNNLLLGAPHGSSIVVRYKMLQPKGDNQQENVILTGTTSCVESYSTVRGSLEFMTQLVVAFVGVAFVSPIAKFLVLCGLALTRII